MAALGNNIFEFVEDMKTRKTEMKMWNYGHKFYFEVDGLRVFIILIGKWTVLLVPPKGKTNYAVEDPWTNPRGKTYYRGSVNRSPCLLQLRSFANILLSYRGAL